jgi:hypothetical protein
LPREIFLARTRKSVAQDRSVLAVHEDLSNGFDQVDGEKKVPRQWFLAFLLVQYQWLHLTTRLIFFYLKISAKYS